MLYILFKKKREGEVMTNEAKINEVNYHEMVSVVFFIGNFNFSISILPK